MKNVSILALLANFMAAAGTVRAQEAVKTGMAEVRGGTIHYEIAGSGVPLVLIHGGQMDCRMWDEQFKLFATTYRVIRYDFRGFGQSPVSTKVFAGEDDLADLLRFLGVRKAIVIGLSLGGRVAIDFALAHPDMTEAIIPVAPGLSGFHFSDDPNMTESWRAAQANDWDRVASLWLKTGYMAPAMENPSIAPRLRELARDNAHEVLDNGALERVLNPPAIERLPEIRVPTLVIVGDRDVADIHEICGLLRARIPAVTEVVVRGSGHIVNMEKPREFNEAVLRFLVSLKH
jgi:pimeloyl-ACP methyl ester carboxylesterase